MYWCGATGRISTASGQSYADGERARIVALCIGVEKIVGLVQLLDNHKKMVSRLG